MSPPHLAGLKLVASWLILLWPLMDLLRSNEQLIVIARRRVDVKDERRDASVVEATRRRLQKK